MYAFLSLLLTQMKCERIEAFMKDFSTTHRLNPPVKPFRKKKKKEREKLFFDISSVTFKIIQQENGNGTNIGEKRICFLNIEFPAPRLLLSVERRRNRFYI